MRLSATSITPLHGGLAHAGVLDAVARLHAAAPELARLPLGLLVDDFERTAAAIVHMKPARFRLYARAARRAAGRPAPAAAEPPAWPGWAADTETRCNETTSAMAATPPRRAELAALRLLAGEALERAAAQRALELLPCAEQRPPSTRARAAAARVFQDSLCAAVYTNAHADFLEARHAGFADPLAPHLHSSPSALNETDLTAFFERRAQPHGLPKGCHALVALLQRAASPTTRGWDTALASALASAPGTRVLCVRALTTSVTGMHACLHPARRPHWTLRLRARRVIAATLGMATTAKAGAAQAKAAARAPGSQPERDALCTCAMTVKEAMRRSLAQTLAVNEAARDALQANEAWVAALAVPPRGFPAAGLQQSALLFARACESICKTRAPVASTLCALLDACVEASSTLARRASMRVPPAPPATRAVVELADDSFRAAFAPLWLMYHVHGVRLARLGPTAQRALASRDAGRALAITLGDEEALRVQRLALGDACAALRSVAAVAQRLGLQRAPQPAGAGGAGDGELPPEARRLLREYAPEDAARVVKFATTAQLAEAVLVVDLGARTRGAQARALLQRMMRHEALAAAANDEAAVAACLQLPAVLRSVVSCSECRRVANAHVECAPVAAGGPSNFNVRRRPRTLCALRPRAIARALAGAGHLLVDGILPPGRRRRAAVLLRQARLGLGAQRRAPGGRDGARGPRLRHARPRRRRRAARAAAAAGRRRALAA
jgi:hypothetical protein